MPRRSRHGKRRRVAADWRAAWLLTGEEPPRDTLGLNPFEMIDPVAHARELWPAMRDQLLPAYIAKHPGRRPWAWWAVEAPELRLRVGGTGMPMRWRGHRFGVPAEWPAPGKPSLLGGVPINPKDPPTFESQPQYLRRLGLLSAAEARRLSASAFTPEAIVVNDSDLVEDIAPTSSTTPTGRRRATARPSAAE